MPFDLSLKRERDEIHLSLPEEETTTPVRLLGFGLVIAVAFLIAAALSEPSFRDVVLAIGGLALGVLLAGAAFLMWQRRYGEARLEATSPFAAGDLFKGWIETDLSAAPRDPVRIILHRHSGQVRLVEDRERIDPARVQTSDSGRIRIPFSLSVPPNAVPARGTWRVIVRTRSWPLGWGATFRLPV
jgi:hypothetical protein